ncbi:SDR family NAD(P)-dependent oxidoreductase [Catenulispora yoronensis]
MLVPYPQAAEKLRAGQVRIAVRAAGIDAADLAAAAATTADDAPEPLGAEIAGVVLESKVKTFKPGDRVFGFAPGSIGPVAVADATGLAPIPTGWTFAEAAARWPATGSVPGSTSGSANGAATGSANGSASSSATASAKGSVTASQSDPAPLDSAALSAASAQLPPPLHAWDVRRASEAFRAAADGREKVVLTIPPDPAAPRPRGTVLITGGTGTLGALVAERYAATGRAAELVLSSRSGPLAPGAAALAARLAGVGEATGTAVRIVSCDAADERALAGLLADVPLTGVVHTAGVLDDGVVASLTPERIAGVMHPKATSAWHLHRLTRDRDLDTFVLFSSAAATLGAPGQGNYAAANAFLDALAGHRHALGLPAHALTWGLWADASAMTGHLDAGERSRIGSSGVGTIGAEDGLGLLELAVGRDEPLLAPIRLSIPTLRAVARSGRLPACLRALAPVPRAVRETGSQFAGPALRERLARGTEAEQVRILTDLVRSEAASVLGHDSPEAVAVDITFLEQGFDSLTAVELRNRVNAITGLRLTGAMAFDHPTPGELAPFLRAKLAAAGVLSGDGQDAPAKADRDARRYRLAGAAEPAGTAAATGTPSGPAATATATATATDTLRALYLQAVQQDRAPELMALIRAWPRSGPGSPRPPSSPRSRRPPSSPRPADPAADLLPVVRGQLRRPGVRAVRRRVPRPPRGLGRADTGLRRRRAAGRRRRRPAGRLRRERAPDRRRPAVLVGFSSGGLVAHAVADRLADEGSEVAGLVLIDTFVPEDDGVPDAVQAYLAGAVLANDSERHSLGGDEWLTALAHYYSMDWRGLPRTAIPTLLLRAAESLAGPSGWDLSAAMTVADVPGDHFSLLRDHAATTAQAVAEWLDT